MCLEIIEAECGFSIRDGVQEHLMVIRKAREAGYGRFFLGEALR